MLWTVDVTNFKGEHSHYVVVAETKFEAECKAYAAEGEKIERVKNVRLDFFTDAVWNEFAPKSAFATEAEVLVEGTLEVRGFVKSLSAQGY